ncbi:MAG: sugar phosphate isomerase/epimerase [Phycisphaerales bacterium]|nr:sugar phosphate isomerase/epimerase [Phycisphaerae bacterium]NNF42409.1 sugar phosphate isomerase/epimerase [Phycisphaerales bacterium]NNM26186.1 sugar phosphate isomerase/epimerase [Phycisphaerales bacterium]
MLLTLATRSLARQIRPEGGGREKPNGKIPILDLPDYAIRELQLRGMNVPASMLAGWSLEQFDRLRDRADKAGCPCLVLIEEQPLAFAAASRKKREAAAERVRRLAAAAQRLGCNALSISFEAADTDDAFELVAEEMRGLMPSLERMELNVLLAPNEGLTHDPDRLTDLIKRIGGFRIGSLPSFEHAAATGDVIGTLRKLAPYAGAVHASVMGFSKAGKHTGFDLGECVEAIRSVGFVNTLAIDYRGKTNAVAAIERARELLQEAIEAAP